MIKTCYVCAARLKTDDIVELTVVAPFRELASKIHFSIGTPLDAYADTLKHSNCDDPKGSLNGD